MKNEIMAPEQLHIIFSVKRKVQLWHGSKMGQQQTGT
jgi:hypothetical protein